MKAGANLIIVEKDPEKLPGGSTHHMTTEEILHAAKKGGFELVTLAKFLKEDTIFIFRPITRKDKEIN